MNISDKILNMLFIKRFCLPVNTDIESYETGINSINKSSEICGNYNHISCILQGKKSKILSFGINRRGHSIKNNRGIHAEHAAILNLLPLRHKKRLKNINILVIRISPINKIQSSKPCYHCIEMLKILPRKRGYNLQYIYYSDTLGNIIKTRLYDLDNEDKHISQSYRKLLKNI